MPEANLFGGPDADRTTPGNVIELPQPEETKLASLFSAAAGPAQFRELKHEADAIEDFRRVSASWSNPRRRIWRQPAIVVVAGTLGLVASSTGLAAAAGARNPATQVVTSLVHTLGLASSGDHPADTQHTSTAGNSATGATGSDGRSGSVASGRLHSNRCESHTGVVVGSFGSQAVDSTGGACATSSTAGGVQTTTHRSPVARGNSLTGDAAGGNAKGATIQRTRGVMPTKTRKVRGGGASQSGGTAAPGGSRGGNQGTGSCPPGTRQHKHRQQGGDGTGSTSTTSTTAPPASTTTTTAPGSGSACDGGSGGGTTTTTTTSTTSTTAPGGGNS